MKLSPKQQKALAWFVEMRNLIPQMITNPVYLFIHRETREPIDTQIMSIISQYQRIER